MLRRRCGIFFLTLRRFDRGPTSRPSMTCSGKESDFLRKWLFLGLPESKRDPTFLHTHFREEKVAAKQTKFFDHSASQSFQKWRVVRKLGNQTDGFSKEIQRDT